jgi:hypothetical protein
MTQRRRVIRWLPVAFAFCTLLVPAWLPAATQAASANHLTTQITLTPRTPDVLRLNENVNLSFSYTTNQAGGVRIYARPYTRGALTPNYAAHGSPLYPTGTGAASGFFTITSGSVTVDRIRLQMWDANQTTLLFEAFLPVHYRFTDAPGELLSRIGLTSSTPNVVKLKQKVLVSFGFASTKSTGVRVVARPLTNGRPTRNSATATSPLYPMGSGTGQTWFTVKKSPATVTQLRLTMWNASRTKVLFKTTIPVHYQFKRTANIVYSVEFSPAPPNILKFGENVSLTMRYTTNEAGGVYIWARPFSGGALAPNYAAHGSPLYPVGAGIASGYFTILGTVLVNQIRVQMWNASQTRLLFSAKIPVSYPFK